LSYPTDYATHTHYALEYTELSIL